MTTTILHFSFILILLFLQDYSCHENVLNQLSFPDNFQFGVSTASFQTEGAWKDGGKGENIWDHFTHNNPSHIFDRNNADIACDSYNKYKEDVQLMKGLGVDFYRFSLSWSRILPTGYPNYINQDGIRFYNNLINELIANGIEPLVTIYHFDLPQPLQEIGGWPNSALVQHFVNFARIVFENFGDRVKKWITINEPMQMCKMAYGDGLLAPAYMASGMADYMCSYTVTRAHSLTYHLYNSTFKPTQKGEVGYCIHSFWFDPNTDSKADIEASERAFEFYTGIYANPVFGNGDWPDIVKESIKNMSLAQKFASSRLPSFTYEEIQNNRGTSDFFALNYYFSATISSTDTILYPVNWDNDGKFTMRWELDTEIMLSSPGLRKTLIKLREKYGDIRIILAENGFGSEDTLDDYDRANYISVYLEECLNAIYQDHINLSGYAVWSLFDNFEWHRGYSIKFGIYRVNFTDPRRQRTSKYSASVYKGIIKNRMLPHQIIKYKIKNFGLCQKSFVILNLILITFPFIL